MLQLNHTDDDALTCPTFTLGETQPYSKRGKAKPQSNWKNGKFHPEDPFLMLILIFDGLIHNHCQAFKHISPIMQIHKGM
jgi:hypothetical protein